MIDPTATATGAHPDDVTARLPQRSSRGLVVLVAGLLALVALALLAAVLGGVLAPGGPAPAAGERLSVPVVVEGADRG